MKAFVCALEQESHHIYCDSFFSGLPTAEALVAAKQRFTICCQANRPTFLWSKCLHTQLKEKGDIRWTSHPEKEILAVSWHDNNKVNILTNDVPEPKFTIRSKLKNLGNRRVLRIKSIPNVVMDYRTGMGCVDRTNSRSNRYIFPHRVRKWPRSAFIGLLQMMITNSWLIFKFSRNDDGVTRKKYLKRLIEALATITRKRRRTRSRWPEQDEGGGQRRPHVPIHVKPELRGTCMYCEAQAKAKNEKIAYGNCTSVCFACSEQQKSLVYLHTAKACFALWHGVDLSSLPYAKKFN